MHQLEDAVPRHFARGVSQRRLERLRAVDDRPRGIQQRDDITRMFDETAEALFGRVASGLGVHRLAECDVQRQGAPYGRT